LAGTGKTTVARLYGQILHEAGLLSTGALVVVRAEEAASEPAKLSKAFTEAQGGVLLLDDAYELGGASGRRAVDALVGLVTNSVWDDVAVVLSGYDGPMHALLAETNPGLARRFPLESAFIFPNLSNAELRELVQAELAREKTTHDSHVVDAAVAVLAAQRVEPSFANAVTAKQLIKDSQSRMLRRLRPDEPDHLTVADVTEGKIVLPADEVMESVAAGGDPQQPCSFFCVFQSKSLFGTPGSAA
jgi:hypothetical protein